MSDLKNYYEVLEVPTDAKADEIYYSYQRARSAYSSDSLALYSLMTPEECRNILEMVEEAYSILSDPGKRKRYDEARGLNREFNSPSTTSTLAEKLNNYARSETSSSSSSLSSFSSPVAEVVTGHASYGSSSDFKLNSQPSTLDYSNSSHIAPNATTTNVNKLVSQKRFALDYVMNADFEKEIEDAAEFDGEFLKKIREYKNLDIERLSDMTKVSKMYLIAIENEEYTKLPAPVYVRGFVFQYAKCLKLKPDTVANSYLARMKKVK